MRESRFDDGAGREARSDARESAFDDVLAVPDDDDDDEALFISALLSGLESRGKWKSQIGYLKLK